MHNINRLPVWRQWNTARNEGVFYSSGWATRYVVFTLPRNCATGIAGLRDGGTWGKGEIDDGRARSCTQPSIKATSFGLLQTPYCFLTTVEFSPSSFSFSDPPVISPTTNNTSASAPKAKIVSPNTRIHLIVATGEE